MGQALNTRDRRLMASAIVIVCLWLAYAAAFIRTTSFEVDGIRHYCLFDDMMISMNYARNLADGNGLIWTIGGQRTEGITNLGWTLYMALLHFTRQPDHLMSLLVQLAAEHMGAAGDGGGCSCAIVDGQSAHHAHLLRVIRYWLS